MALLTSGEYKLFEKDKIRDNKKSIIFVKLTDSAQRALSDFLKNQSKCNLTPIIEFNNNVGLLQIPTSSKGLSESDTRLARFNFNVLSNVAMQGQQGLFECIQLKHGSKRLLKYGPLTKRLRIHASEDVFETTKNRMAEVDLEQRKICTREIDLNLETVNRRVKMDKSTKTVPAPACSSINSSIGHPSYIENKISRLMGLKTRKAVTKLPKSMHPIMKKSLRERIIHMLAVRPLKKVEIVTALKKDGIRESERAHLMPTLGSLTTLKDNVYHLLKHVWNDIQDDWPFYTEQEMQQMKRNQPQNLTPPTSDSGISNSSNRSPCGGSPGPEDRSSSCQYKRPGYYNGVDGFQTKRQRISHFSRPVFKSTTFLGSTNQENVHQISPSRVTNSFDEIIEKSGLSSTIVKNAPLEKYSKQNPNPSWMDNLFEEAKKESSISSAMVKEFATLRKYSRQNPKNEKSQCKSVGINGSGPPVTMNSLNESQPKIILAGGWHNAKSVGAVPSNRIQAQLDTRSKIKSAVTNSKSAVKTEQSLLTLITPEVSHRLSNEYSKISSDRREDEEISCFKKQYITIIDLEQRRQYKDIFSKHFNEYSELEKYVTPTRVEFTRLQKELMQLEEGSSEFTKLAEYIRERYDMAQKENFCVKRDRFEYLHLMLSHIKQLVNEYDLKFYSL